MTWDLLETWTLRLETYLRLAHMWLGPISVIRTQWQDSACSFHVWDWNTCFLCLLGFCVFCCCAYLLFLLHVNLGLHLIIFVWQTDRQTDRQTYLVSWVIAGHITFTTVDTHLFIDQSLDLRTGDGDRIVYSVYSLNFRIIICYLNTFSFIILLLHNIQYHTDTECGSSHETSHNIPELFLHFDDYLWRLLHWFISSPYK